MPYISKITISSDKSYHKEGKINLSEAWKKNDKYEQLRTLRHEIGHLIDYQNGYISMPYISKIKIQNFEIIEIEERTKK